MLTVQTLDVIPLWLLFFLPVLALLASMEIGYRLRFLSENHGEGGLSQVPFPPLLENGLLDMPVDHLLASLCFVQRGKLDQIGADISSIE